MNTRKNNMHKEDLNKLLPIPVTHVVFGAGSLFTLEHSQTSKVLKTWVYLCNWLIVSSGVTVADSDSDLSDHVKERIAISFIGKEIVDILFYDDIDKIEILFSGDFRLILTPDLNEYEPEDDMLIIFLSDKFCYSYSPIKKLYYEISC